MPVKTGLVVESVVCRYAFLLKGQTVWDYTADLDS